MPIIESIQHKLDRVRPPRVQITYDVETAGAIERVELPFVMGVVADLRGASQDTDPATQKPRQLKDREFIEIDRDNFNQILRAITPSLVGIQVPRIVPHADGTALVDGEMLTVDPLMFTQMDDFNPASIVRQVSDLAALFAERQLLRDLLAKADANDDWRTALETIRTQP